jgi:hypothetical protein
VSTRTAAAGSLDRYDGLILAMATIIGMLASEAATSLEPPAPIVAPAPPTRLHGPQPPAAILVPTSDASLPVPQPPAAVLVPTLAASQAGPQLLSAPGGSMDQPVMLTPAVVAHGVLERVIEMSRPFLTAWTLALPILGYRRPRPPRRLLARQPGIAACGIATLVLSVQLSAILLGWAVARSWTALSLWLPPSVWPFRVPTPDTSPLLDLWRSIHVGFLESSWAAHGIAGAWLIMALGGWWRPERSAIDRLGRALGTGWIAVMVAGLVGPPRY